MISYLSLQSAETEITVQRSRFIAYVYGITDEADARQKLIALKKKHYNATHVCYAYIADEAGNISKTSDDGEPSGTAGAPMLAVISKYRKIMCAVVRYFGGTKLGVGGLVKAYSDAAAMSVGKAEQIRYTLSDIYEISLSYAQFERCRSVLGKAKILDTIYMDGVKCRIAIPVDYDIVSELTETLGQSPGALLKESGSYINY